MTDPNLQTKITGEIAAIKKYLEATVEILDTNHMPDITSLENRVAQLCKAIQTAPAEVHEVCLPLLVNLMEQLAETEKQMRLWNDAHKISKQ
jgi:hypothetical protein